MKKALCLVLILALTLCAGCASQQASAESLRFADSVNVETLRAMDGKTVSITGYMATLSPVSGKYIYLMNLPYQSCPFCVPNTTQLSNTMAVYAPEGQTFGYTDQAIRVTGTMEFGDFTDEFGYVYPYRIVNAKYETVDLSAISQEYALWYSIAEDGVVADISAMFDYLCFVCMWPEYQSTAQNEDGTSVTYFLYPGDVENYLADDSAYGYAAFAADDYYPSLIKRVKAISATELDDLVSLIEDAKTLEQYALGELKNGGYVYDEAADQYALNKAADLSDQFYALYARFSNWMTKWEL